MRDRPAPAKNIGIDRPHDTWPEHTVGKYQWGGDSTDVLTLRESPPDQETVRVVLMDSFLCTERGKVIDVQRRHVTPLQVQEDL